MSDMYSTDAATARLPPGTRLNGIFEIERRIASGGMGEVYRGRAIETGDPVAIKVMRTDLADNETALALFRKEASALHYIHHEAIVRYYIFSSDPGIRRHYLAMEFVDGQPLSELLKHGPVTFEAVRLLQQRLAAGLHAAHQGGIIHRDVSPDNVLIPGGDVGRAKIIDFGIARSSRVGDGTIIGSGFAGKYNYVSPEQLGLFGGDVTAKSDIYSLGLVLAECLSGQPIDMGGSQFEVIEKRRALPHLGAVDLRFRPLLEHMLQPDPRDRPESMAAVAAWRPDVAAKGRPAAARGRGQGVANAPPPAAKPGLGRKLAFGAVALVLLMGLGSVGVYIAREFGSAPAAGPQPNPEGPTLTPGNGAAQRRDDERRAADDAARQRAEADARKRADDEVRQRAEIDAKKQEDARKQDDARKRAEANLKTGPAKFSPTERPSADPRERISQFVNAYDGGNCFFVVPVTVADGKATLEGYGSSVAPFEVLDYEFKRQNGFEASIGVHQVTPSQCAAVSFLSRMRNQPGTAPRLDISTAALRSGGALTGSVADFGARNVDLLLVADDGYVHNLSGMLRPSGDTKSFNLRLQRTDPGPAQPQLLFAVASARPLEALKAPQLGTADQVFAQVFNEGLQSGQAINVSAKYFKLDK